MMLQMQQGCHTFDICYLDFEWYFSVTLLQFQAEVKGYEKESIKIPIAVLKAGETRTLCPNLEFPSDSVTFKLIQGTGPVYICGQHLVHEMVEEEWHNEDDDECDEDNEDDEQPPPQQNGKNSKKK